MLRELINIIKKELSIHFFRKKWRKLNLHNLTYAVTPFPLEILKVGKYTYGPIDVRYWGSEGEKLEIGNFVSIAEGVKFILGGNHSYDSFSTYPFKVLVLKEKVEARSKGPIAIEDDVWIGMNVMVLSGVRIGKGAVIGAGAIVTKDVPPYAIVVGNPAKIIKYRFDENTIKKLINFDFESFDEKIIKLNIKRLYKKLDSDVLDQILNFGEK